MIIFNIWALPVVAVIVLLCLGVGAVAPQCMDGTLGNFIVGVLTLVTGIAAEYFGARGRLFFMPIWLIGLVIIGFQLFSWLGGWGILIGLALCVGGVMVLFKLSKRAEIKQWGRLQRENFAEEAKFATTPAAYWAVVRKHFIFPAHIPYSPEVHAHNLAIFRHVLTRADLGLNETDTGIVKDLNNAIETAAAAPKPEAPARESLDAIYKLITRQLTARAKA